MSVHPKHGITFGLSCINSLYEAAKAAKAVMPASDERDNLATAIEVIESMAKEAEDLSSITEEANGYRLGDDGDVDVIGDFTHHNGETGPGGGHWVDAWIWVPDEEEDEDNVPDWGLI